MAVELNFLQNVTIHYNGIIVRDEDDACMKAAIESFAFKNVSEEDALMDNRLHGRQIVLYLKDLQSINVIYATDGQEPKWNKEVSIVVCAVNSILKHLYNQECVGKEHLTFQARRGDHIHQNVSLTKIFLISLNGEREGYISFKKGYISHTYAYLDKRELCLFLNEMEPDILEKIMIVLANLFPMQAAA